MLKILSDKAEENRVAQVSDTETSCALLRLLADMCSTSISKARTVGSLNHSQWLLVYLLRPSPLKGSIKHSGGHKRKKEMLLSICQHRQEACQSVPTAHRAS